MYIYVFCLSFFNFSGMMSSADTGKLGTKFFHLSGYTLVALLPVALVYCPSPPLTIPLDLALGVIMPIHGHVGLNYIISDYVPQSARGTRTRECLYVLHFKSNTIIHI